MLHLKSVIVTIVLCWVATLTVQSRLVPFISTKYTTQFTNVSTDSSAVVFVSESTGLSTKGYKVSWVNIPIQGTTKVYIKVNVPVESVVIKPRQKQIRYTIHQNTIELTLDKSQKLTLEVNGDATHPLYVFADAKEKKRIPRGEVVYFAPGFHSIGSRYPVKSNTTYHLASGAYLRGDFYASGTVENVRFTGHGVIDAGEQQWQHPLDGLLSAIQFEDGRNICIEGITLVNAGNFQFKLQTKAPHTSIVIRNVNMIGWNNNTDGIHISDMDWKDNVQVGNAADTRLLVENCFIRANDDAILLCDGIAQCTVRSCVFVDDGDGATFCLSWGAHQSVKKVRVSDCYVISKKKNNPVFRANHAGESHLQNIEFKNIYIDGAIECLIGLHINAHRYDPDPGFGCISNIRFKNIYLQGTCVENRLMGLDAQHTISNIHFDNLVINGKKITNLQEGNFLTNEFVQQVTFR